MGDLDAEIGRLEEKKASMLKQRVERAVRERLQLIQKKEEDALRKAHEEKMKKERLDQIKKLQAELAELSKEMEKEKTRSPVHVTKRANPFESTSGKVSATSSRLRQGPEYGRLSPVGWELRTGFEDGEVVSSPPDKKPKLLPPQIPSGRSTTRQSSTMGGRTDGLSAAGDKTHWSHTALVPYAGAPGTTSQATGRIFSPPSTILGTTNGRLVPLNYFAQPLGAFAQHVRYTNSVLGEPYHFTWGNALTPIQMPTSTQPRFPDLMPCPYWSYMRDCQQNVCGKAHDPLAFALAENALCSRFGSQLRNATPTRVPANLAESMDWIPCEGFLRDTCAGGCGRSHNPVDAYAMYQSARLVHPGNFYRLFTERGEILQRHGIMLKH